MRVSNYCADHLKTCVLNHRLANAHECALPVDMDLCRTYGHLYVVLHRQICVARRYVYQDHHHVADALDDHDQNYEPDGLGQNYVQDDLNDRGADDLDQVIISENRRAGDHGQGHAVGVSNQTTPVVVDGVMYVTDSRGSVYAVDAADGHLLWTYDVTQLLGGGARETALPGHGQKDQNIVDVVPRHEQAFRK